MPKHSLFMQRREGIKGSPIAKRNLLISLLYYSFFLLETSLSILMCKQVFKGFWTPAFSLKAHPKV